MFSYRHSFHAGNHADVLKHITQIALLNSLKQKDKPFSYIDTHAGAGIYDLTSEEANKTGEHELGIGRTIHREFRSELVNQYVELSQTFYTDNLYPGSPMIAHQESRVSDKIHLMEWHNTEIGHLKRNLAKFDNVSVHHRDGFEGLLALLPPKPARGLVLIDPPYERIEEYQFVIDGVKKAIKKWPHGIFAIWYPLIIGSKNRAPKLLEGLADIPCKSQFVVEMQVSSDQAERGMYGSGMCVINPPWRSDEVLAEALEELTPVLQEQNAGQWRLNWSVTES
ncbi:23S rRNA (adenine(2030)-N(6))-methyltransferase RlmJ [Alteromonadaceae bacterium M269]|nr:23S rRNA (adenine(2030)-N(6))-methyltransferase RlmJ [Alteromonadaceae bacterium M269]